MKKVLLTYNLKRDIKESLLPDIKELKNINITLRKLNVIYDNIYCLPINKRTKSIPIIKNISNILFIIQ